ncbi:hypothetical protein P3S68_011013 [Capsicum galapagoense]
MGDHAVEIGRILDYKDELLRTNPGTSCVVKLSETNKEGKPKFLSFYICFDALKKTWMLPLAWAVVEKKNTNT